MLAVRLDQKTETRLDKLAKETHRNKSYFVKRAITSFLDEMEDKLIAVARLEQENPTFLTSDELWRDLGWDKPADNPSVRGNDASLYRPLGKGS